MPRFGLAGTVFATLALGLAAALPAVVQTAAIAQQQADKTYQAGMQLLREKRYRDALKEFKLVEQYTPQLPQGYSGEGLALALMGEPEEATRALREALHLDPSFWVARRELGIIYWQLNQRDQAAKELYKIAELFPTDSVVNSLLGRYEFTNQNYSQAVAFLAKAPDRVEAEPDLALIEARALLAMGQTTLAGEKLESLKQRASLAPQQTFQLAWLLGQAKHFRQAIEVFNSLPPDLPESFGRGYGLALAYYEDKQYAKCVETLQNLRTRGITRPELFALLGVAEEQAGHTLETYDAFRQGIDQFSEDDRNYLNAATFSVKHFNYEVATEILSSGIKLIADDYKLFLDRGIVYSFGRQLDKAIADYRKALQLAPQESIVYTALGICYIDQNKFDKAAAVLREGISRQPKDVLLYYFLADAMFRTGITTNSPLYDQALSTVESSLRIDPNFADAYLQRARLELIANKTNNAIADLEHARSLQPDSRAILYQLAVAYRQGGRHSEAAKLFASITEASKKEDAEWQHLSLMNIMVKVSDTTR